MKAKSKVLLGLLVALAMMVLAVPAFAATTTFDVTLTPSKDEGLVVYTGNTGKINVAIKDEQNGDAEDVYSVKVEDKLTGVAANKLIPTFTMTLNGEAPSGNLKLATNEDTEVAKHPVTITVEKTSGAGKGEQSVSNYIVDVKQNIGASLSTGNLKEDDTDPVFYRELKTGAAAEISVTREKGSEADYTYKWQIAKAGADVSAAAYIDPSDKTFEDISGETGATLQKVVDIDDNGKYVRCIVTDGAGNQAVASALNETLDETAYCVRLVVTDEKLVIAQPTEDQDISIIMTQEKGLTVQAKAGTPDYHYKWLKDGVAVTGGADEPFVVGDVNGPTLTLRGDADKAAEGDYVCEVTDDKNVKVTSPVFHVTVADMPKLTLDPSVVSQKAEYRTKDEGTGKAGDPIEGSGDTFVATADAGQPLTLTANLENPADVKSVKWETCADPNAAEPQWKSEQQGESTTFTVAAPANGMAVRATVEFKDIPCSTGTTDKALVYTTNVYVTDGTLSGNVYTYIGNDPEKKEADKDPQFDIMLPSGVYWTEDAVTKYTAEGTELDPEDFDINLPEKDTNVNEELVAVVAEAPVVGQRTLSFKIQPKDGSYPINVIEPYVKNMTVKIDEGLLSDTRDGQGNHKGDVVLPVSDGVGYKIMRSVTEADLTLKKKTTPYNTKEQPAEVIGANDAKIGEVSEVRYMTASDAEPYVTVADGKAEFKEGVVDNPAQMKAFLAALKSDVPVDTNEYIVVCNVAESDELAKADNLLVPDTYKITAANKNTVEKDPATFFTWTKEKVFNGKDQDADVKFADGMTKAGKIKKVTYMTTDKDGVLREVQPNAVGTYKIYVETERDPEEVDSNANVGIIPTAPEVGPAYIGDFEITKLPVTADLFKMNPTEADYTGNPIVPEITTETPGVGEIEAVHYYAEGSEEELGSAPVKAGVYTVKIDVKEGENYRAEKGVEVGTLTIKSQETNKPTLYMRGHVQNKGWDAELTEVKPGSETMIGTTGSALRVEAIDIVVPEGYTVGGFAHVQNEGDVTVKEVPADAVDYPAGVPEGYKVYRFGSTGKGQRLEAIQTEIKDASGALLEGLSYQVHVENKAWMGYVANGSFAGTRALGLRLEALRFAYEGTPAPTEPQTPAEPEKPAEETPATPETPETPAV